MWLGELSVDIPDTQATKLWLHNRREATRQLLNLFGSFSIFSSRASYSNEKASSTSRSGSTLAQTRQLHSVRSMQMAREVAGISL